MVDNGLEGSDQSGSNADGQVNLQVAGSDADRARKILAHIRPAEEKTTEFLSSEYRTFACQECGKIIIFPHERRGSVETCPYCFKYIDVPNRSQMSLADASKNDHSQKHPQLNSIIIAEACEANSRTNSQLWLEVFAVLCLAFFPSLYNSIAGFIYPSLISSSNFIDTQLYYLIHAFQVMVPLLFILTLSKERWYLFGIVRPSWLMDIFGAFSILLCIGAVYFVFVDQLPKWMFERNHYHNYGRPEGIFDFLAVIDHMHCVRLLHKSWLCEDIL